MTVSGLDWYLRVDRTRNDRRIMAGFPGSCVDVNCSARLHTARELGYDALT